MVITWQTLAYLMEIMFIGAVLFSAREMIISKIYGIRYKRWQEVDTGRYGYVILNKDLNSCKINGMIRPVNRANIVHGVIYFISDVAENVKAEDARDKYQFYMNSEEFDTVYKNKLLQTLMMSLQNDTIMIILVLILISIAIGIYGVYSAEQLKPKIEFIVWKVNNTGY